MAPRFGLPPKGKGCGSSLALFRRLRGPALDEEPIILPRTGAVRRRVGAHRCGLPWPIVTSRKPPQASAFADGILAKSGGIAHLADLPLTRRLQAPMAGGIREWGRRPGGGDAKQRGQSLPVLLRRENITKKLYAESHIDFHRIIHRKRLSFPGKNSVRIIYSGNSRSSVESRE